VRVPGATPPFSKGEPAATPPLPEGEPAATSRAVDAPQQRPPQRDPARAARPRTVWPQGHEPQRSQDPTSLRGTALQAGEKEPQQPTGPAPRTKPEPPPRGQFEPRRPEQRLIERAQRQPEQRPIEPAQRQPE
jgi:hypothetical protein